MKNRDKSVGDCESLEYCYDLKWFGSRGTVAWDSTCRILAIHDFPWI